MREALAAFCQGVFLGLILIGAALSALYLAGKPGAPGFHFNQNFFIQMPTHTPTPEPTPEEYVPPPTPTPGVGDRGQIPGFKDPHTFKEKLYYDTRAGG